MSEEQPNGTGPDCTGQDDGKLVVESLKELLVEARDERDEARAAVQGAATAIKGVECPEVTRLNMSNVLTEIAAAATRLREKAEASGGEPKNAEASGGEPKNAEAELVILERIAVCAKNYLICRRRQMDAIVTQQNAMVARRAAGGDRPGPAEGQAEIDRREATGLVMKAVADLTKAVDMLENASVGGLAELIEGAS